MYWVQIVFQTRICPSANTSFGPHATVVAPFNNKLQIIIIIRRALTHMFLFYSNRGWKFENLLRMDTQKRIFDPTSAIFEYLIRKDF